MQRITNQMISNTLTYNLNKQQVELEETQNKLSTGKSIRTPSDNPIGTANQMIYQSRLTEITQYISNIDESKSRLTEVDTAMQSTLKIFQRIRVLTVQGANGTYSQSDRKDEIATEINELLEEMISIANSKGANGRPIFSGHQTGSLDIKDPFVSINQTTNSSEDGLITNVEYRGDIGEITRELENSEFLNVGIPGNKVFWATNQILTASKDSGNYTSETNQIIRIDGKDINISAGDNLDIIVDKINNAGLPVRALKGGQNNMIIESTTPHQIWLEDAGSGRVFKDLGLINTDYPNPPNNISPTVTVGGMSIFEMMIQVRDDFRRGDQELIGGRDLGLIDLGLENLLKNIAAVGAKQNRVDELSRRAETTKENVLDMLSKTEGVDMAEAIMNYKWLESVHHYALAIGAKSISPTLMDFLR